MFPWSNVHIFNAYLYNLSIHEDDKDIPKENLPPPLPLTYPKYIL